MGIPVAVVYDGRHYLIKGRWWAPPLRKNNIQRVPDSPPPFTGTYNEWEDRWVNIDGQWVLYYTLNFMQKLLRARPPWCLLTPQQKQTIINQIYNSKWWHCTHCTKARHVEKLAPGALQLA